MAKLRTSTTFWILVVFHTHAAWGQNTGGHFGGSNWGNAPSPPSRPPIAAPPMVPPTMPPIVTAPSLPPPTMPMLPPPAPPPMPTMPAPVVGIPAPTPAAPTPPAPPVELVHVTNYRRPEARAGDVAYNLQPRPSLPWEHDVTHPPYPNRYREGPARLGLGAIAGLIATGLGFAVTFLITREMSSQARSPSRAGYPHAPVMAHPGVEVRRVSVALDWNARAFVQQTLAQVAATTDMSTPQGLHKAALAARDCIARSHAAIRYANQQSWSLTPDVAQATFAQVADQLRGRYTVETINQTRRTLGPAMKARAEEGGGLVVVTLLVAVKGPLAPLPQDMNRPAVLAALEALVPPRADRLAALEVVWSPAEDADRMSSAELETLYPELVRLDDSPALGRKACAHCRAVYAGELGRCPACGAG